MSTSTAGRGQVKPAYIVIAGIALLAFMVWIAYANLFAPPPAPPMNAAAKKVDDEITALAKKCNGDFNKLNPEDQQRAQTLTAGNARQILPNFAKD